MAPRRENPTETEKRLDRAEAAINALAYLETRLAGIPRGLSPELDAIREEYAGRIGPQGSPPITERRPSSAAPEQRREAVA
jgi:hypothetical protein